MTFYYFNKIKASSSSFSRPLALDFCDSISADYHHHHVLSTRSFLMSVFILLVLASDQGTNVRSEPQPLALALPQPGLPQHDHEERWQSVSTTSDSPTNSSLEDLQHLADNPFENNTNANVTIPLGDSAFLHCKVKNLGERAISWIRRRDMHIITVGRNTYTNDERFHILHVNGTEEWTLQIKFVQKRDNGTYECQVSTGKGIASSVVHLFVAIPEAFILGNGEYHIEQGSTINLVCIVEKSPKPPDYIFWYHNDRMINYGSTREVSVQTETGSKTHSRLIVEDAQVSDSGNYTCQTANADPASTMVYISQGDKIAAIQRRKAEASVSSGMIAVVNSSITSLFISLQFTLCALRAVLFLYSTVTSCLFLPFHP